jgi:hypothetical protein
MSPQTETKASVGFKASHGIIVPFSVPSDQYAYMHTIQDDNRNGGSKLLFSIQP